MKRSGAAKFPSSVQLFKFCQKVLSHQRGTKVRDQEVGAILNFNPSDCSHWKRGEKNVRSVFALAKLSEALAVEPSLVHDVASGNANLAEAFYEFIEASSFKAIIAKAGKVNSSEMKQAREHVRSFVEQIHKQADFSTPPLYLPEVLRFFSFIITQPTEMLDKLSRILRVKAGQFCIQFQKGDLRPQTRMSIVRDLARIIFHAERSRFPELGPINDGLVDFEEMLFTASLLVPKNIMADELAKLDSRKNVVAELSALFWVPKSLICFQLQDMLKSGDRPKFHSPSLADKVDTITL